MVYGHLFHIDGLLIHINGTMTIPQYGYTIQVLTMAHMSKAKKTSVISLYWLVAGDSMDGDNSHVG